MLMYILNTTATRRMRIASGTPILFQLDDAVRNTLTPLLLRLNRVKVYLAICR